MADDERLPGQRVGWRAGEVEHRLGDVLSGGELAVHRVLQHDVLDHLLFGDAKVLRNAGARVTDDVLRTLVLASYLLGVKRVMVVPHTDCRMTVDNEDDVHLAIATAGGPDTRSLSFMTTGDIRESLAHDVQRVRSYPYLNDLAVAGFIYHIDSGRLEQVD